MLRGDTISRCSCQGLEHGIIMANFHIWGGSGCLSPRCFLPLTPVRPYYEQKYHYALTSRWSPSPSRVFVLIWVMHWLDYKPDFWFFRWQSLQRFRLGSVLWLMSFVQKKIFSDVYQEYYMELFLETLSCRDPRVKARALYDTRSAGAWCDHLSCPLRVSVGHQSSKDLQSSLDPLPSTHLRGWHPKTRGRGEAAMKAAGNELTPCGTVDLRLTLWLLLLLQPAV